VLLESVLQALPGVDHAVVFGAGRKAPVALLTLADPPAENLTNAAAFRQLAERLAAAVPATLAALPGYSHPAGLLVSLTPLTVANQSLTPSLKLRRWALAARYQPPLDRLYAALEARPGERFCEALAPDLLMFGL
jgi:long-chain acyl-CoA synthetase